MIKVAVWGTGMMGQGLLGYILDRPNDIELVGAIVTNPAKEGKTVGELLSRSCDVCMTTDADAVLAKNPEVVCICTQSNLDEIASQVEACVKADVNVLCIAEKEVIVTEAARAPGARVVPVETTIPSASTGTGTRCPSARPTISPTHWRAPVSRTSPCGARNTSSTTPT